MAMGMVVALADVWLFISRWRVVRFYPGEADFILACTARRRRRRQQTGMLPAPGRLPRGRAARRGPAAG